MKPVFEYIDFRKFLSDYYTEKKERSRVFSFRYFSNKAGINSPSFLKHVIDGKRNLTRPVIEKFCAALGFSPKEELFFRNLVLFNQAKTAEEKQEYYTVLRTLAGGVSESVLEKDQYDYFSQWYNPVIRELICIHNYRGDYKKLGATVVPSITPSDAKKAVLLLERLRLVKKKTDGSYGQTSSAVTADSSILSMAVRAFTKTMIDHSKNAIDLFQKKERHISSVTMGVSAATYDVLAQEVEAFKDRLKAIVNRDTQSNRIYQMTISLFPVSANADTGDSNDRNGGSV